MLCSACTRLFDGYALGISDLEQYRPYKLHHPDSDSFRRAKALGCDLCSKFWFKVQTDPQGREDIRKTLVTTNAHAFTPPGSRWPMFLLQFDKWVRGDPSQGRRLAVTPEKVIEGSWLQIRGEWVLHVYTLGFEMVPAERVDTRSIHDFGLNSRSTQSYDLVRKWLVECLHRHKPKIIDRNDSFYPERVLDVGQKGGRVIHLRSLSKNGVPADDPRYATLSYCWGQTKHLKLEAGTLEKFQDGINVMELPRTMRQAVACVRELGIRFLWMDSLCIIQDSKADWRDQSAKMGSIYQNSHINIAATSAKDSEGGLFYDRELSLVQPTQIKCHFPFEDLNSPLYGIFNIVHQNPYWESVQQAPLNSRAWVTQERLLAPRTLHCTNGQLFWECEHLHANESYPDRLETTLQSKPGGFRSMVRKFGQVSTSATVDGIKQDPAVAWLSLMREYSECRLTRDEDILIAISGLAKRWSQSLPDQYLAGLWRASLAQGLLWFGEPLRPWLLGGKPCSTWRAPSWSWASFKGAVTWSQHVLPREKFPTSSVTEATLMRFADADLVHVSGDETGQLLRGSIVVHGALIRGVVSDGGKGPTGSGTRTYEDFNLVNGLQARRITISTKDYEYSGHCYFDDFERVVKLRETGIVMVTCFPILLESTSHKSETETVAKMNVVLEGIIVERVDASQLPGGMWKRVGYFCASSKPVNPGEGPTLSERLKGRELKQIAMMVGLGQPGDLVLV